MKEVHVTESGASLELIPVGRFTTAHGLKGWIKVYSYTDPPENIIAYTPWYIRSSDGWVEVKIIDGRRQGKSIVVLLDQCESRDDTDQYAGVDIAIPATSLAPLEDGEYYWDQLQGLEVVNTQGQRFGRIDQLMQTGANDVMVVKADKESTDDQERLIPFVMDKVIRSIDLDAGKIIVDWDASW